MFGNSIVSCQLGDSIEEEAAIRRDTDTVVDLVAGAEYEAAKYVSCITYTYFQVWSPTCLVHTGGRCRQAGVL
jgi:hypothetical protein